MKKVGYVRTKPDALAPFRPSVMFPSCTGFYVRATIESVEPITQGRTIATVHAWEPDGYEVVFTSDTKVAVEALGTEVDVPGHAILAYSGSLGPWAQARIRTA
jgi:hypothetical protein